MRWYRPNFKIQEWLIPVCSKQFGLVKIRDWKIFEISCFGFFVITFDLLVQMRQTWSLNKTKTTNYNIVLVKFQ
jgi:hypothetical protein